VRRPHQRAFNAATRSTIVVVGDAKGAGMTSSKAIEPGLPARPTATAGRYESGRPQPGRAAPGFAFDRKPDRWTRSAVSKRWCKATCSDPRRGKVARPVTRSSKRKSLMLAQFHNSRTVGVGTADLSPPRTGPDKPGQGGHTHRNSLDTAGGAVKGTSQEPRGPARRTPTSTTVIRTIRGRHNRRYNALRHVCASPTCRSRKGKEKDISNLNVFFLVGGRAATKVVQRSKLPRDENVGRFPPQGTLPARNRKRGREAAADGDDARNPKQAAAAVVRVVRRRTGAPMGVRTREINRKIRPMRTSVDRPWRCWFCRRLRFSWVHGTKTRRLLPLARRRRRPPARKRRGGSDHNYPSTYQAPSQSPVLSEMRDDIMTAGREREIQGRIFVMFKDGRIVSAGRASGAEGRRSGGKEPANG